MRGKQLRGIGIFFYEIDNGSIINFRNLFENKLYLVKLSPQKAKAGRTEDSFFAFWPIKAMVFSNAELSIGTIAEKIKPILYVFDVKAVRTNNCSALRTLCHNLKIAFFGSLQKFFGRHGRNGKRSFPIATQTTEKHKLTPFEALTKRQYRRMSLRQISRTTGISYQKLREEAKKF